jgi:hypothetical protein
VLSSFPLGGSPHGTSLVLGGTSPHARGDPGLYRPGQARGLRRASPADPFGLVDLAQRRPYRADREEELCVGVTAGGMVTPVGGHGHRLNFGLARRTTVSVPGNPIRIAYSLPSRYASLSPGMVKAHHPVHVISPFV